MHNKEFKNNKLIKLIQEQNPDIIVITGNLVDARKTNIEIAVNFIVSICNICSVYYINGNHEGSVDCYSYLEKQLLELGVILLNDKIDKINMGNLSINICGFSDPYFKAEIDEVLNVKNRDNNYTILLSHRPENFDFYVKNNFDLVFSGHAHGGQWRIPFVGGVLAPHQGIFPIYDSGVYKKENTIMIVSRGLGNSIFPIRIDNNPELIVVTLENGKGD